ncbi:MAG: hypothetical protein HQM09_02520 [Candidatus Riflebacteria bacterium]|nr:hypothetical protein [Candidatus Riflebacteria bacterium]
MNPTQIPVFIDDDRGLVSLKHFIGVLDSLQIIVTDVDRSRYGETRTKWSIAALEFGSARATIQAFPIAQKFAADTIAVVESVLHGLREIEDGASFPPEHFSQKALEAARNIGAKCGSHVSVSIGGGRITTKAASTIDQWTKPRDTTVDSIEGSIEAVSLRGVMKFSLYDEMDRKIDCFFPDHLKNRVKQCLGERVIVRGEVGISSLGRPVSIKVLELDVRRQKPFCIDDYIGIWNIPVSSEEYVRAIRDE